MEPHQCRMIEEKEQLDQRIARLAAFFDTETYQELPDYEKLLMQRQWQFMTGYSEVLGERIAETSAT